MAEAFVQNGVGVVQMSDILSLKDKAFWPLAEKMVAADLHEAKHLGVTVRRDWETIEQHQERVTKRAFTPDPEPTQGMDPERARFELARQQGMLAGLTPEHPDYDKLFDSAVEQIHHLERDCGLAPTRYTKGERPKVKTDVVDPELVEKLSKYLALKVEKRRQSIVATVNADFLELIRDNETDSDLQALAVQRIMQVKAA